MIPNVFPGAPAVMPGVPAGAAPTPIIRAAAGINFGNPGISSGCVGCTMQTSQQTLRDIETPGIPMWAKVLGVMTFLLIVVSIGNAVGKRKH
jgi:hypothetical protein